jgi:hypothetical protein
LGGVGFEGSVKEGKKKKKVILPEKPFPGRSYLYPGGWARRLGPTAVVLSMDRQDCALLGKS